MRQHDPRDDYDDEPWKRRRTPEGLVRLPASMMWVFGLLQLIIVQLYLGVGISTTVLSMMDDGRGLGDLWQSPDRGAMLLVLAVWLMATVCTIIVMRSANDLRSFRRFPWVVAGVILTLLSVPFFYLGIVQVPLAIWIIVLLHRGDVRDRFEAVARGTIESAPQEASNARTDRAP
jgi:hypothetical protein